VCDVISMKTQSLVERHRASIEGVLECFDRVILFGTYRSIGWPAALAMYLRETGVSLQDFARQEANQWRLALRAHVLAQVNAEGMRILQVSAGQRKEEVVAGLLRERGDAPGVVCVLGSMERCATFRVRPTGPEGLLRLQYDRGRCEHYYIYLIDPEFGLCYLRIPTWAPFRLQFYCNGHHWLERQMQQAGLTFTKQDNCFTHLSDPAAAQALVQKFDPRRLQRLLDATAARWVQPHTRFGQSLYWTIHQAEWSTDIIFKNERILPELFSEIARTAAVEVGCEDIYRFLGKTPRANAKNEALSQLQTFTQGLRLKHTLGATSLKIYDKAKRVLRIECTTHDVSTFTHHRKVEPRQSASPGIRPAGVGSSGPAVPTKWAPMRKTFYNLGPLGEAMGACNRRYLGYLSQWQDQTKARHALSRITTSQRDEKDRSVRGINFFREDDLLFLQALQRGEHQIRGVTNRLLQAQLPGWNAAKIGRNLRRFRTLKLLKPVRGKRHYYPTARGETLIVAGRQITERIILPALAA
jgi:hypothetical protein